MGALSIRPSHFRSQLYAWLNELFWGYGYYQEALTLASQAYFEAMAHAEHYSALVDASNKSSYYALKKNGFQERGLIRGPRELQYDMRCLRVVVLSAEEDQSFKGIEIL